LISNTQDMSIKVHLYSNLRRYTDNRETVHVRGSTVGECLHDLVVQYPPVAQFLFDENGSLLEKVFVSINLESTYREKISTPVEENDEMYLILIVAGG
jgi:molybdopterin converting factor small subunit